MSSQTSRFYQLLAMALGLFLSLAMPIAFAQQPDLLSQAQTNQAAALDDKEALNAQADHAIQREITVEAKVKKLLPPDTQGLPHQKFLIELSNGSTILIAHDTKYAPSVPIQAGNVVRIHGEYIWNKLGGLIHWTHHSDSPKHDSGWIDFNGQRYE